MKCLYDHVFAMQYVLKIICSKTFWINDTFVQNTSLVFVYITFYFFADMSA